MEYAGGAIRCVVLLPIDGVPYAHVLEDMTGELRNYLNDLPGGFAELKPKH